MLTHVQGSTIYNTSGHLIKLTKANLATNSVDTDIIASGAVTLSKLNSDVLNKLSQIAGNLSFHLYLLFYLSYLIYYHHLNH